MITNGQVRVAIAVLRAYVAEELRLDDDVLDELERAIEAAYDKLPECMAADEEIICEIEPSDFEPPLTSSR